MIYFRFGYMVLYALVDSVRMHVATISVEGDDSLGYTGLTGDEMGFLDKLRSSTPDPESGKSKKPRTDGETVEKSYHDERVADYKSRIEKLESKISDLKGEKTSLSESLDFFKGSYQTKCDELKAEKETSDGLKRERSELLDELARVRNTHNRDVVSGSEYRSLESEYERLKRTMESKDAEVDAIRSEVESLKESLRQRDERVSGLEAELSSARDPIPTGTGSTGDLAQDVAAEIGKWTDFKMYRPSPSILRSERLTHPVYKVVLSRDGGTLTMTPDVEGGALCNKGDMLLPCLAKLIPYAKGTEYDSRLMEDGTIVVSMIASMD